LDSPPPPPPPPIADLIEYAVQTWEVDEPTHRRLLDVLDGRAGEALAEVERRERAAVAGAWERGWTPADIAYVVGRELGAEHRGCVVEAVLADARRRAARDEPVHPRWRGQVDALADELQRVRPLALRLATLAFTERLAAIPPTLPPPGAAVDPAAAAGLDPRILDRVRALLAKAESTEFPEEAEALTAKAQELIARHAIDEALLRQAEDVGAPLLRRITVEDPYADAKALLLDRVASANRCRAVYDSRSGWVTAFGYPSALDAVELLAASLLAQATAELVRQGSRRDAGGRSRTRSFRRSFLVGFALRIGERLRAATDAQGSSDERERALPVLSARAERIDDAVTATFPGLQRKATSVGHAEGFHAGQVAADLAELGVSGPRLPG
jgi:hypothetical protein